MDSVSDLRNCKSGILTFFAGLPLSLVSSLVLDLGNCRVKVTFQLFCRLADIPGILTAGFMELSSSDTINNSREANILTYFVGQIKTPPLRLDLFVVYF